MSDHIQNRPGVSGLKGVLYSILGPDLVGFTV